MDNCMTHSSLELIKKQRKYYSTGETRDIKFRIKQLKLLKAAILSHKKDIVEAIEQDFGVSGEYEGYGRILFIIDEIKHFIKNLKGWLKPVRVKTPFMLQPGKSKYLYEPLGVALIIGSWNAPFNVTLLPLIAALGAGNCCVLKPSELAPASSKVIAKIINTVFAPEYCTVVAGDIEQVTALLECKFDLICYTGGTQVGGIVYQAAAKQLTPVILELGGKSPCIVDETANIKISAKRICQAKHMIAGQVCTSPDYLLVHKKIKQELLEQMQKNFEDFYPEGALLSVDYSKIINEKHFARLSRILARISKNDIISGGRTDQEKLKIEPTLIDNVKWDSEIMQDEIFGPLIPIIEYSDLDVEIANINKRPKPLALYIYSKDQNTIEEVIAHTTSGAVGVNISIQHYLNKNLPFGGVGQSGFGTLPGRIRVIFIL